MFRTVVILFGLIMFAILYPVYQSWGIPGAMVVGAIVPGLFGILAGVQRSRRCSSAKECFKADEQVGCGGVGLAALVAMVTGSFVAHQDKNAGFPVVVGTFILGTAALFGAAFLATYLKWRSGEAGKKRGGGDLGNKVE
jgi:hypothetical protein